MNYNVAHAGFIINRPMVIGLSDGLVGYWTFDGPDMDGTTAYDRSGQGNNGTLTNGPKRAAGKIGQGMGFNNASDYVSATGVTALDSAGAFTMAYWGKRSAANSIISVYRGSNTSCNHVNITPYSDGLVYFRVCAGAEAYGTVAKNDTEWHHYIMTYDGSRSGNANRLRAYIDGIEQTLSFTGTIPAASGSYTGGLDIGRHNLTNSNNGTIDDVRIYNRALTADEIKRLYKIGATTKIGVSRKDTLTDGLVGYWTFDGLDMSGITAYDRSGQGNNATTSISGGSVYPPAKTIGKIGQALQFDGLGNSWTSTKAINLSGTNVVTVSFWYYLPVSPVGNNKRLLSISPIDDDGTDGLTFQLNSSVSGCTGNAYVSLQGNVGYNQQCFASPSIQKWHHVVVIADKGKTSEEVITYVDGVPVTKLAGANADNTNNFGTQPVYFMTRGEAQAGPTNGTIDDVRIYNRALSADEIKRLYKIGATTKIGVSRKDTLTDGLVGYWTFDGLDMSGTTAYDRSGQGNNGTLTNGPVRTTGKIGQGIRFNRTTNQDISFGDNVYNSLTTGTISAWIKSDSFSGAAGGIFSATVGGCGVYYAIYMINGSTVRIETDVNGDATTEILANVAISNPQNWHQLVYSVNAAGNNIYIDGQKATPTYTTGSASTNTFFANLNPGTTAYKIGRCGGSEVFSGVIDDVRIYNRALAVDEIKRLYLMGK